ncbi:MAG TPA: response regulator transcription factor [Anaerolineae bacterium]|nr:response regulator transcription factor [Anaerolineae bacterium]
MTKIRVLLADDQDIIRTGLTIILNHQPDLEVVGQAADGLQAIDLARQLQPDVILMDIKMPNLNGIQATRQIVTAQPHIQIIILTTYDTDDWVFDGIRAGAIGYLLKDTPSQDLAAAVRGAMRGESQIDPSVARKVLREFQHITHDRSHVAAPRQKIDEPELEQLTDREEDVLKLLAAGLPNKDIALKLSLSEGTVKNHISAILAKLHANDRTQAVLTALKRGLVDLGQ